MYSSQSYLHLLVHDVGCLCTLNGVTFTYLQQKYKALILDNVVRAPSIVANGLLQYPQTKGDPFFET